MDAIEVMVPVFAEETLEAVRADPEIGPMLERHYRTRSGYRDHLPLRVNWAFYERCAATGRLHLVTGRLDGKLIAYFPFFLGESPHYTVPTASADVYFLAEEHRGKGWGALLFRAARECAMRHCRGHAKIIWLVTENPVNPISAGLKREFGLHLKERVYFAILELGDG